MHPLFAIQIALMRGLVDAAALGTMAAASGMVVMQQAAERALNGTQALTQITPTALGTIGGAGVVEVKVAARSASGHAMALGIEMPVVPFPGR